MAVAVSSIQQFGDLPIEELGSVYTRSLTITEAGSVLVAGFWCEGAGSGPDSVTFDGLALTATAVEASVAGLWTLLDPPVGTFDFVVTLAPTAMIFGAACVLSGVDLDSPFGATDHNVLAGDEGDVAEILTTVYGQSVFSFIISEAAGEGASVGTPGVGQTLLWSENPFISVYSAPHAATMTASGDPETDISWTGGTNTRVYASIAFNAAHLPDVVVRQVVVEVVVRTPVVSASSDRSTVVLID